MPLETWTAPITPAASRRKPIPRWKKLTGAAIAVAILAGAITFGGYKYYSRTRVQIWNSVDAQYEDTYRVWDDRHLTRYYSTKDADGTLQTVAEGPMSESGRPHGEWTIIYPSLEESTQQWYWYGEPITEGEWHLRNR